MSDNILNARLQHAVEYTDNNSVQHPDDTSIPLNGEIVFNDDRTNFKVGDGREEYQNLPDFLPTIPAAQIQSDWNQTDNTQKDFIKNKPTLFSGDYNDLSNKPTLFSGSYNDLSDKPSIPSKTSDLQNDSGFLTSETEPAFNASAAKGITSTDVTNWNGKQDAEAGKRLSTNDYTTAEKNKLGGIEAGAEVNVIENITVNGSPVTVDNKTAALTIITKTVNDLTNYYTKSETYTKTEVNSLIAGFGFEYVQTLPTENIKTNVIYLVPKAVPQTQDIKDEYIYITNVGWELIGSTSMDLSNYVTTTQLNQTLQSYLQTETDPVFTASPAHGITSNDITNWNNKSDFSGSYNDLTDKPTIPAAQIQSDWNQSNSSSKDYIKNKPTIPAAQIQSDWNQTNSSALDYIKNKPNVIAAKPVFFYDTTASGAYTDFTTILNSLFYNIGHQYSINDYSGILINIDYINQTPQGSEIINTLTCDSLFRTLQTGIEFSIYIQSSTSLSLDTMYFHICLGYYGSSRIFNEAMYFYGEISNNNGIFKDVYPFKVGKDLNDNYVYVFNSCIKVTNLDNSRLYFN